MTDTEILDYLQESLTMRSKGPTDVLIGSVLITTGLRPGTLRELFAKGIEEDRQRIADKVAFSLSGRDPKWPFKN